MLNFLAIGGGVVGSFLIASNIAISKWGYIFFLVSSLSAIAIQYPQKEQRGLLYLSMFYVCVNVYGLLSWFNII